MAKSVRLESTTSEVLRVKLVSRDDPTGTLPGFELTDATATDPTETWASGTWITEWSSVTGEVWALSPLIGQNAAAEFQLTEGVQKKLWCRWTHGSEDVHRVAAVITPT